MGGTASRDVAKASNVGGMPGRNVRRKQKGQQKQKKRQQLQKKGRQQLAKFDGVCDRPCFLCHFLKFLKEHGFFFDEQEPSGRRPFLVERKKPSGRRPFLVERKKESSLIRMVVFEKVLNQTRLLKDVVYLPDNIHLKKVVEGQYKKEGYFITREDSFYLEEGQKVTYPDFRPQCQGLKMKFRNAYHASIFLDQINCYGVTTKVNCDLSVKFPLPRYCMVFEAAGVKDGCQLVVEVSHSSDLLRAIVEVDIIDSGGKTVSGKPYQGLLHSSLMGWGWGIKN